MRMAEKRLPIYRNEHKQMRRNCYQQGRMEDHSIQCRVRQGTAVSKKATGAYFIPIGNKLRGRPKTTLPIGLVFNRDLALIQHPIRLHSSKDLQEITELAQDRKCWRGLTSQIKKAAKESQTKNWDAKRH